VYTFKQPGRMWSSIARRSWFAQADRRANAEAQRRRREAMTQEERERERLANAAAQRRRRMALKIQRMGQFGAEEHALQGTSSDAAYSGELQPGEADLGREFPEGTAFHPDSLPGGAPLAMLGLAEACAQTEAQQVGFAAIAVHDTAAMGEGLTSPAQAGGHVADLQLGGCDYSVAGVADGEGLGTQNCLRPALEEPQVVGAEPSEFGADFNELEPGTRPEGPAPPAGIDGPLNPQCASVT
jgi:hypothetical protein